MRIFIWKCKEILRCVVGVAIFTVILLAAFLSDFSRFEETEGRVFYLHNASSQALQKQSLDFSDLFSVQGESVFLKLNGEKPADWLGRYGASVVFIEKVGDIVSYYGYTAKWSEFVIINGRKVNVHLAVDVEKDVGVVGTPIVFGGY